MARRPSEGIGRRLAKYRRLRGLSARELADQAGMGLTRGVIANIESGRKSDVTVDQLIALSTVLGVPPVSLALPLDEPYQWVKLTDGTTHVSRRTVTAVSRFQTADTALWYKRGEGEIQEENDAAFVASELLRAVNKLEKLEPQLWRAEMKASKGEISPGVVEETRADIEHVRETLERLGANLTRYNVDD